MPRSHQGLVSCMVVAAALSSGAAAQAQLLPHGPKPDPAAQQAALEAQQAIRQGQSPNQFGTHCCQILQIPAAAFNPMDAGIAGNLSLGNGNGYVVLNGGSLAAEVWAPVTLPSGAALDFLTIYYYDTDSNNEICVDLDALAGTTSPSTTTIATACSALDVGYGYSTSVASGTINNDVVGGGAQYVLVLYDFVPSFNLQFKAVDIWWHRQVSPAPATATFNDVPTDHPFFQYVEALVASGITAGCQASPPLYCPDAPLTRRQMAAFLSKALGLYWPH